MAPLTNAKHELFAQEIAKGRTLEEAYALAGYARSRSNSSVLRANQSISDRIAEIQRAATREVIVTVESLIREADEIQQLAIASGQLSAANGAMTIKAKMAGLWVDKTDNTNLNTNVNPSDVTDAEIAAVLKVPSGNGIAKAPNGKAQSH